MVLNWKNIHGNFRKWKNINENFTKLKNMFYVVIAFTFCLNILENGFKLEKHSTFTGTLQIGKALMGTLQNGKISFTLL